MQTKEIPFSDYPWVEYDRRKDKYEVSPQKLSMFLTGPESPIRLKAVEQVGMAKPSIYYYDDGYYKHASWNELHRLIKSLMPPELRTSRNVNDVIYELETEPSIKLEDFNSDEDIVNVNNGIYHISTGELTPHTPEVLSSIRIPCNYDSNLTLEKDAPVFSQFLEVLTNGDDIEQTFLLEFIGAVFSNIPGYRYKKCLLLVGPGNSGKSQLTAREHHDVVLNGSFRNPEHLCQIVICIMSLSAQAFNQFLPTLMGVHGSSPLFLLHEFIVTGNVAILLPR